MHVYAVYDIYEGSNDSIRSAATLYMYVINCKLCKWREGVRSDLSVIILITISARDNEDERSENAVLRTNKPQRKESAKES